MVSCEKSCSIRAASAKRDAMKKLKGRRSTTRLISQRRHSEEIVCVLAEAQITDAMLMYHFAQTHREMNA